MFEFQNLEVYKKAKSFHQFLKFTSRKPGMNRTISDQLFRASFSIPLNIAEGSGRFTNKDRRNFFIIARSSVFECVAILDSIQFDSFFTQEEYVQLISTADELSRMLYTMIKKISD